jgi:hypothetical protein
MTPSIDLFARLAAGRGLSSLTEAISSLAAESPQAAFAVRGFGAVMGEAAEAAERASSVIETLTRSRLFSGGSAGEIGQVAAAFEGIGLNAGKVAEFAAGLRELLEHDPRAIRAFGRMVTPVEFGGPTNNAAILREVMQQLEATTNEEDRLRKARMLGAEALLPLVELEEKKRELLLREGEIAGARIDDELRQRQLEADANATRKRTLDQERETEINRSRLWLQNWVDEHILLPWKERNNDLAGLRNPPAAAKPAERHAKAVEENTQALEAMRRQFINGRGAAEGAVPKRLGGEGWRHMDSQSLKIGAFSL